MLVCMHFVAEIFTWLILFLFVVYLVSVKCSSASSHVRWLDGKQTIVQRTISVLEVFIYSPLNHLTWLLAQEYFIEFS